MLDWLGSTADFNWFATMSLRLAAAVILGGLLGYEREHANRPAGFRTHILVCLGSALVMVTSEYLRHIYASEISLDPTRLGAQVISGIGFLGAGTIIRNGSSVKGLTTAASLWAVCCIGLACGGGFYSGAILATILTFLTLVVFKRIDMLLAHNHGEITLLVNMTHYGQDVIGILEKAKEMHITVRKMQIMPNEKGRQEVNLRLILAHTDEESKVRMILALQGMESIQSVSDE
jgi:putative Mg2+ transporter-C (MgtC) family protein